MSDTTFAIWRLNDDDKWHCGKVKYPDHPYADGSEEMLSILDGRPHSYIEWATDYYETDINPETVNHIYSLQPLNNDVVKSLNPDATMGKLHNCFVQIGYPGANTG